MDRDKTVYGGSDRLNEVKEFASDGSSVRTIRHLVGLVGDYKGSLNIIWSVNRVVR
jgi:hypothetical protein